MKKAIILSNGVFPHRSEALNALLQIPLLICCDGACNKLVASSLFAHASVKPEVHVIGDGDSMNDEIRKNPPFPITFVDGYDDQETNDLTKAVKYALSLDVTHLIILGATGLREDHTLGNISLLGQYVSMKTVSGRVLNVRIYSDYGFFTPLTETTTLPSFPRQQVSLFSLTPDTVLSTDGLKYPILRRQLHWWWEATLNEAIGTSFTVTIENKSESSCDTAQRNVVIVYQTHEAK